MCSVLLNASVDVRYENPETVGDPVAVSLLSRSTILGRRALLALAVIRDYLINCSRKRVSACVRSRLEHSSSCWSLRDVRVALAYLLFHSKCFGISILEVLFILR